MIKKRKILIYGYGNPGRQDDGLGILLADAIEKWVAENNFRNISTDSNYQLNLEDAADIANHDVVIFADASKEDIPGFLFEPLKPSAQLEFTMHAVAPQLILHLCQTLFDHNAEAYLLHIKGYEWEFMKEMTANAKSNLELAQDFLKNFIIKKIKNV